MPETEFSDERDTNRRHALLAVERALREHIGPSLARLEYAEIRSTYPDRHYSNGWRFSVACSDGETRRIDLVVSADFPSIPPRAALVDRPDYLTWPHIEHDGILCLLNNLSEVDPNNPGAVALNIVNRAVRLVEELIEGKIVERDFREEFLTYWFYGASSSVRDVVTLFDPPQSSCMMRCCTHEGLTYVARDDDDLARWTSNRFGEKASRRLRNRSKPVAYIRLSKPPMPKEYPQCGADVMALAQKESEANAQLLSESALQEATGLLCLFAAEGRGGPGIVPVHIDRSAKQRGLGQPAKRQIHTGFRPGKTPDAIKLARTFGTNTVRRTQVARADGPWIHGRGKDARSRDLLGKSATVFGCGSVGSFVAENLARSGVGGLNLVDYDELVWANVGRHVLGATSVGRNKALALAERLQREFPHLEINGFDASASRVVANDQLGLLDVDVIASLMGNWAAESLLDQWHGFNGRPQPVVYGWTEDHALAGSAVAVAKEGGSLACGLDSIGEPKMPAIIWSENQQLDTEPSCADHYRPYGAVELAGTTTLISRTIVDELLRPSFASYRNLWIGRSDEIAALGGSMNPDLLSALGSKIVGSQAVKLAWPNELSTHRDQASDNKVGTAPMESAD
jgi:hypothetical protein